MSLRTWLTVLAVAASVAGCAQNDPGLRADARQSPDGTSTSTCQACVIDSDCSGGVCAQRELSVSP